MRLFSILIVIAILAFSGFPQTGLKTGSPAPVFTSQSLDGNFFDLEAKRGSVVLLTFWSTSCEICRTEIPRLNELTSRYKDKGVIFIALTMESETHITPFLRKNPFTFTIMPNSLGPLLQYADRDKRGNLDMGFPAFFVIDQTGRLDFRSSGFDKTGPVELAIDRLVVNKRTE